MAACRRTKTYLHKKTQIKTTWIFHLNSTWIAKISKMTTHADRNGLFILVGVQTDIAIIELSVEVPQEAENQSASILLFIYLFWGNRSHFVVLVDLKLTVSTRLAWNSWRTACLSFQSAGVKGLCHHFFLLSLLFLIWFCVKSFPPPPFFPFL